ncbi:MAG: TPM domain-containing protein [Deltaproteobacteria bacterium]|nr:TPM domain-containing protein [Deltaproteobacteria bacterium]MCW5806114.1 TPM domain-containing protein [Deltaproteobacteria bacterium]
MIALALAAAVAVSAAAATPPAPTRWVEDRAGMMSAGARERLDARLASYERATGHQVIVWIGKSLEGGSLDEFANRAFNAWKLGRKGLDDGVALFVFSDDRKLAIEVGYGLEGQLTDARASRIIREVMAPKLRAGDADGAITAGTDAVLESIEGKPWGGAPPTAPPEPAEVSTATWIAGAATLIGFLILALIHPRFALLLLWTIGRGLGGGGGGGFGGGGGRSGGGGARGGW